MSKHIEIDTRALEKAIADVLMQLIEEQKRDLAASMAEIKVEEVLDELRGGMFENV